MSASRTLRVATYNLYLGADLSLIIGDDPSGEGLREVLRQLAATDFSTRVRTIAEILRRERLDMVGLQEVCSWSADGVVFSDFLSALLSELEVCGEPYAIVSSVVTFGGATTVPLDDGQHEVAVTGSNVLLRRSGSDVAARDAGTGLFGSALTTEIVGRAAVRITRGWCAAWCDVGGVEVLVVDTHAEAYDPEPRDAQRDELLQAVDRLCGSGPAVLLGDFNARPAEVGMSPPYVDAWTAAGTDGHAGVAPGGDPGATCGQRADLTNPLSALTERIDYVFVRGLQVRAAHRAGHRAEDRTPDGLWCSDHVAVVAELTL